MLDEKGQQCKHLRFQGNDLAILTQLEEEHYGYSLREELADRGLRVALGAYGANVFLDFRELMPDGTRRAASTSPRITSPAAKPCSWHAKVPPKRTTVTWWNCS